MLPSLECLSNDCSPKILLLSAEVYLSLKFFSSHGDIRVFIFFTEIKKEEEEER